MLEIREDVNRSVRFIRANHRRFDIDPDRIGIAGASSGGLVALLVGCAPLPANPQANDPVDRVDGRVQALACFFPGTDYLNYGAKGKALLEMTDYRIDHRAAHDFRVWDPRGQLFERVTNLDERRKILRELSPIYHISAKSPPTLLVHGDQDEVVPCQQSESFVARLKEAGVPAKLAKKEGKGHDWRTIVAGTVEVADWFDEYLRPKEEKKRDEPVK
jgi:dipeptidyl aminopeptidase/acylaminoacyl peptidase